MPQRLYLTLMEVQQVFLAMEGSRHCIRNRCMILMCFIHGFRVSELTGIKVSDIDFHSKKIYIRRLKNGLCTIHPLHPKEFSLLNNWMELRNKYDKKKNGYLFLSSGGGRLSRQQFYKLLQRYGTLAEISVHIHPHMLRHACGFELAEQGLDTRLIQDYLGHKNIRHTVHYTASNAARFANAWQSDILQEASPARECNSSILYW